MLCEEHEEDVNVHRNDLERVKGMGWIWGLGEKYRAAYGRRQREVVNSITHAMCTARRGIISIVFSI